MAAPSEVGRANFRIALDVSLTSTERRWVAACISDAAACADTDQAARLIEARMETMIRARLEPFADFAADLIAYAADHAEGPDTAARLAFANDLLMMIREGSEEAA